jgi:hypothetical protein
MKKHVVKALQWALSKFDDKPALIEDWPFPAELKTEETPVKKATVPKATTRKIVAKKTTKAKKK